MLERGVYFSDRYGADVEEDINIEHFSDLLVTIAVDDGDAEHRSISLLDEHEWNLEFYPDSVLFENVDAGGERVGELFGLSHDERLEIARLFIIGDFTALRAYPWG